MAEPLTAIFRVRRVSRDLSVFRPRTGDPVRRVLVSLEAVPAPVAEAPANAQVWEAPTSPAGRISMEFILPDRSDSIEAGQLVTVTITPIP